MDKIKLFQNITIIIMFIININSYASNCNINTFDENQFQYFIKIKDAELRNSEDVKSIFIAENAVISNLTEEKFQQIISDPNLIAQILGGEIEDIKDSKNFRLAMPAVLGMDLSFDVQLIHQNNNRIKLKATNFNHFILEGEGEITLEYSPSGETIVKVQGTAYIPNNIAKMFILGVGGQNNFKNLLQSEIDNQKVQFIDNYHNL